MADNDFGGTMKFRLADGTNISLRGTFNLSTAGTSIETLTNQDGSLARVGTPKPRTAEISFEDSGLDHDALMKAGRQDMYITEEFTGVTHVFVRAFFSGEPMTNRLTGEVTGATINAPDYQRLGG
ncbi:hypothetical protein [Ancylobacter sp. SL191]|uniref:hypothetical protein n=1 Tax=Ancylobacter sp. SL191 TaxID=2995166 RepID=UPI002271669D|nr:hypothetical protein [Ancylobacter sp. SL191]WAC26424.1 hypothetical protein OU996_15565 [Ancylobacter sp. SL191]